MNGGCVRSVQGVLVNVRVGKDYSDLVIVVLGAECTE